MLTGVVIELAQEHKDLDRFGTQEPNTICPKSFGELLFVSCNELRILYKVNTYVLLYLKYRDYLWCPN
jgi:hypothetical protein